MGYSERQNLKSRWNKRHSLNMSSNIASPISTSPVINKAPTPAQQGEPLIMEFSPKKIWETLCRRLHLRKPQSLEPTN